MPPQDDTGTPDTGGGDGLETLLTNPLQNGPGKRAAKKTAAKKTTPRSQGQRASRSGSRGSNVIAIIRRVARELGVPPEVALAVAYHESGLNPTVAGDGGHSVGLFQLYDQGLGAGMSVAERSDPEKNARVAIANMAKTKAAHPDWGWAQVAVVSQNPADHPTYKAAIQGILGDYSGSGKTATRYFTSQAPAAAQGSYTAGGSGGGGGFGTPDPLTKQQYLDDPQIEEKYGYLSAYLNNKEIGPILAEAAKKGWGANQLLGALSKTEWWQTMSATARAWQAQKRLDPATATQRLNQMTRQIQTLARSTLGYRIDDQRATHLANTAIASDWSQQDLQHAVGAEFHYQGRKEHYRGAAARALDEFDKLSQAYLVPLSRHTLNKWTRGVLEGVYQPQDFENYVKQQAESLYPTLKGALKQGQTTRDYLNPYAELAAQTLEINPGQINWFHPKWAKALNTTTPDGQRAPMSLSDWQTYLRSLPEFKHTAGAQQTGAAFALNLAQTFGKVAV